MLDILLILSVFVSLTWCLQFHWNRRSLYRKAANIDGPAGWPLIGNSLDFIGDAAGFVKQVTYYANIYPKITKVWLGPELMIGVYDPEVLEVILKSPKALTRKELVYRCLVPLVGFGLLTGPVTRWKRHRKTISPSFNQQVLNGFMGVFSDQCTILVDQLHNFADKGEFDIMSLTSKWAVNVTCDGVTFPKGSTLFISILDTHRSDRYWPDPLKFNPDRFLPEEAAKRHPYCFLPFSAGPRNCIGYRFALMVLKTMVASVIRTYKVSTRFKRIEDIELIFEVTLGSKHGFPVSLQTR